MGPADHLFRKGTRNSGRGAFCPVCRPDRTKVFHVKHFGPIDTLRKRTFPHGSWYEAGIWGKRTFAIRFMLGCGCLPGQTIIATLRGVDAKIFLRSARKSNRLQVQLCRAHLPRNLMLLGNRLMVKSDLRGRAQLDRPDQYDCMTPSYVKAEP
jgi:hypothetical protein